MCRFIQYIVLYASFCAPYNKYTYHEKKTTWVIRFFLKIFLSIEIKNPRETYKHKVSRGIYIYYILYISNKFYFINK